MCDYDDFMFSLYFMQFLCFSKLSPYNSIQVCLQKFSSSTFTQTQLKFVYLNLVQTFMYLNLTQTRVYTNLVQVCLQKLNSSMFT